MNKYKRLASDTFLFAIGNFGSKLIMFFLLPLYTKYLSKAEYGTAELVDTISVLIVPIVSLMIYEAVLRFALDKNINNKNVLLNAIIVFLGGALISLLLTPLLGLYHGLKDWKWFVYIYAVLDVFRFILFNYIKAKDKIKSYVLISLTQTLTLAISCIVLLTILKMNILGLLSATIISNVVVIIIAIIVSGAIKDLKEAKFDKKLFIDMVKYSAPLVFNNISWWIIQSSDKIMVESFLGSAELGLYSVACKIPAMINIITNVFGQAWGISSVKEFDSTKDESFYSKIFKMNSLVVFMACSCLLLIIRPFMGVYVSKEFSESWKFVPFLLVAATFSSIAMYFIGIYTATKKTTASSLSTIISAIVNVVLNLILIPRIGVMGAVIATAIAYLVSVVYRMINTRKYYKFKINYALFIVESILISIQAYLVITLNNSYIASGLIIIFLISINYKSFKEILDNMKRRSN